MAGPYRTNRDRPAEWREGEGPGAEGKLEATQDEEAACVGGMGSMSWQDRKMGHAWSLISRDQRRV